MIRARRNDELRRLLNVDLAVCSVVVAIMAWQGAPAWALTLAAFAWTRAPRWEVGPAARHAVTRDLIEKAER